MLTRRHLLLLPILLLAACGKPAESPPPAAPAASAPETGPAMAVDSAPEEACPWAITLDGNGVAQVEPDPGMGSATVAWQGALNEDHAEDFLLRFAEGCSNYGECPYGLYVACIGEHTGRYREVWAPDYALEIKVGEPAENGWRPILRMRREGDRMIDQSLTYTDGGYRATAPSH